MAVTALALALGATAFGTGCSAAPGTTDPSYAPGELGNGGFVFSCDDSVACDKYSGTADKFPKDNISVGSRFNVRFLPKGAVVGIAPTDPSKGQTLGTVGDDYLTTAPGGAFSAQKAGFASLVARSADGRLVDFITVEIQKPDSLVVYDTDSGSSDSDLVELDSITLKVGESKSIRALARAHGRDLAGALRYDWTAVDASVVGIGSATDTRATIVGKQAGTTSLMIEGGSFQQTVKVEVTQ
jgi:hypothetical protein